MALVKCAYTPAQYNQNNAKYTSATASIVSSTPSVGQVKDASYNPSRDVDITLEISDLTNGKIAFNKDKEYYWTGSEILDVFLNVLGDNLKIQYDNGRITGNDYSQAYMKMMEIASTQSLHFLEVQRDLILKDRQVDQADSKNAADVAIANARNFLEAAITDAKLKVEVALHNSKVTSDIAISNAKNAADVSIANAKNSADIGLQNSRNELDACLQNNKLALEEKKVDSDIAVANRQIAGYDDNLVIKLLQCELDAFALIYSSGMLDNPDLGPLRSSLLTLCWQMLFNRIPEAQAAWKEHERVYGNG